VVRRTLGIVGGIAPESTIDYYRKIVMLYQSRVADGSYPSIIINSIDLKKMLGLVAAHDLTALTDYFHTEMEKVAEAGADFALFASNTPHIVFDDVRKLSSIPLISIVEATCAAAQALGAKRAGLIGTRFTMQGRFYRDVFSRHGIEIVIPHDDEQDYIHEKYMNELVNASFLEETRAKLLEIITRMRDRDSLDALILGGTELPLILRESENARIPLLDTTRIHAEAAVDELLA
jgi:aspartate racemase